MATTALARDLRSAGEPVRHAFTVDDYYRMAEAGVLPPGRRTELIDGDIIDMSPIGPAHAAIVRATQRCLQEALGRRASLSVQLPIRLGESVEPQPDVAVLAPKANDYADGHPVAADVLLVLEVSDTTLAFDREVKAALYAGAGITEYWLIDVSGRTVDVHRAPAGGRYTDVSRATSADAVSPAAFPDVRIDVGALFGQAGA